MTDKKDGADSVRSNDGLSCYDCIHHELDGPHDDGSEKGAMIAICGLSSDISPEEWDREKCPMFEAR